MFKRSKLFRLLLAVCLPRYIFDEEMGGGGGGATSGGMGAPGEEGRQAAGGLGGQGGTPDPYAAPPRSWSPEHHPHWSELKPEVRKLVYDREAHVERGFQAYRPAYETWNRLSKHFEPWTSKNPQIDVAGLMESLAQNHIQLAQAEPAQRVEMFRQLAEYYGVDLTNQAGNQPSDKQLEALLDQKLRQALTPFQQRFQALDQQAAQEHQAKIAKVVDSFFSDPKNKYVNEVAPQMLQYIQTGEAKSMDKAYKLACLEHPTVRAKYLADLASEGQEPSETGSNVRNLKDNTGAPPGKSKSMEADMEAIVAKHYGAKR